MKVATISLAYDNSEVIEGLTKRGSKVLSGDFKALEKIDKELCDLVDKKWEQFSRPVHAFVTFTTQEA